MRTVQHDPGRARNLFQSSRPERLAEARLEVLILQDERHILAQHFKGHHGSRCISNLMLALHRDGQVDRTKRAIKNEGLQPVLLNAFAAAGKLLARQIQRGLAGSGLLLQNGDRLRLRNAADGRNAGLDDARFFKSDLFQGIPQNIGMIIAHVRYD
ncbi:hypothetical protein D3C71_1407210 [compost metagenome]